MNAQISNMQKELESKNQIASEAASSAEAAERSFEARRLLSLQDENDQLKTKVGTLEAAVHELEKTVKKLKGGLKDRGSVNVSGPTNGIPAADSKSREATLANGGGTRKIPHSKDVIPYMDVENTVSKGLEPSATREYNVHHSQKTAALFSGGNLTTNLASHPPQAMGLHLRPSHMAQDIHPGVFSKADKPDRGKPLTRIL